MAHDPKIAGIGPSTEEVIEGLPLAIMVFDESLNIRMANPAAEQVLGLSAGFLLRQCVTNLVDEDGPLISLIRQVFEEKSTVAEFGLWLGGPRLKKKKVDVRIASLTESSEFVIATIQDCALYPADLIRNEIVQSELMEALPKRNKFKGRSKEGLTGTVERHLVNYFAAHKNSLPASGLHDRVFREIERPLITQTLIATKGNQIKAAEVLGINRNTLRAKIRKLDIRVVRGIR